MRLCACVLWNKCERALLCFVCLSSCVLCENDQKSLCFCVFFSCVWWSTQTQNQFFTKITMFDFFKVKKPLCKSVLKLYQLILVIKIQILAEKSSVLCFVFFLFFRFCTSPFSSGCFGGKQNTKQFCAFVSRYLFEWRLCRLCFVHFFSVWYR